MEELDEAEEDGLVDEPLFVDCLGPLLPSDDPLLPSILSLFSSAVKLGGGGSYARCGKKVETGDAFPDELPTTAETEDPTVLPVRT